MQMPTSRVRLALRVLTLGMAGVWLHACVSSTSASGPCVPEPVPSAVAATGPGIVFRNELGSFYRLTRLQIWLDGALRYDSYSSAFPILADHVRVSSVPFDPGKHSLTLLVQLRGWGEGDLAYLRGYRFVVKSSHDFTDPAGASNEIQVILFAKGTCTPMEQRPVVRYVDIPHTTAVLAQPPSLNDAQPELDAASSSAPGDR